MKVLIVNDTHKQNHNYFKIVEMHKPDMVIHCGDVEGSEYAIAQAADCPVHMVMGNNDFFSELPRELELEIAGYRVLVTHGHNYYVSMGNERLKSEALSRGFDMVFYGHTHRPVVDMDDDIVAVNPGSLAYPRQEDHVPTYVIMEVDDWDEVQFTIARVQDEE